MKRKLQKLIESFKADGLTISEDQQKELDTFVEAFDAKIAEAEAKGKATAKEISLKLGEAALAEYDEEVKKVTESLIKAIDANHEAKIAAKVSEALESDKEALVEKIDDYLKLYIEEILPESLVVDYDRMQRQDKAFKALKETLLITDEVVQAKATEVSESIGSELVEAKAKLNETIEKNMKLNKVIKIKMADELLESKIEDLPSLEATKLRKYFEGSSCEDIEDQFDTVYESIKEDDATTIEVSKIKQIIEDEEDEADEPIKENKSTEDILDESSPLVESWLKHLR